MGIPGAADLQTAYHTNADGAFSNHPFGGNEWLGSISLNSQLEGILLEADNPIVAPVSPVYTLKNVVAWGPSGGAFNVQGGCVSNCINLDGGTFQRNDTADDVFRVDPRMRIYTQSFIQDIIASGHGRFLVNSATQPSYVDAFGTVGDSVYHQTTCAVGCKTTNPLSDGNPASLKYITRIENGSVLKGAGHAGADIGANGVNRYGNDGAFYGDPGYNTLTGTALWPWPNEARMQQEMCTNSGVTRGFCSKTSLTEYIWTFLGNPMPDVF
jgi:hypothetical protein